MKQLVPIAAAFALVTSACGVFGGGPPEIRRDQRVAASGPPELADAGPSLGVLREAWRIKGIKTPRDGSVPDFRIAKGQLLIGAGDRVAAYDVRTGRKRWHYREPGRTISGYSVAGDAVVTSSAGTKPGEEVTTGLDAGTGEMRWERGDDEDMDWLREGSGGPAAAAGIVVGVTERGYDQEDEPVEIVAVDAVTGDERWRREHVSKAACDSPDHQAAGDTDGSVLVFWERCSGGGTVFIHAFDPADGQPLWSRRADEGDRFDVQVSIRRGATLIQVDEDTRTLVGRDDRELANLNAAGRCDQTCTLLAAGDRLAYRHVDERGQPGITLIDGGKGRPLASGAAATLLTSVGERLYGLRAHLTGEDEEVFPPAALEVIDPGRDETLPMPLPYGTGEQTAETVPMWMGAAGARLMIVRRTEVVAYASGPAQGPPELGGVPQEDWPDACPLLKEVPGKITEERPEKQPITIGSVRLDRPRCTVTYKDSDGTRQARTTVDWVAPSPGVADAILPGEPQAPADEVLTSELDEAASVRVGRYIVRLEADRDEISRILPGLVKALR